MFKRIAIIGMTALIVSMLPALSFAADESGHTISLKQAHRMALKNNPNMKNVAETIYQADLLIYKAWAILLPNLSANGSITRNSDESKLEIPDFAQLANGVPLNQLPMTEQIMQELWSKNVGFSANMTIFNARSIPLLKKAYNYQDASHYTGKHRKNDLLFAVSMAYYQVNSTKELIKASQDNLKNAEEFLRLTRSMKAVGQGTKIDVLRAETEVMNYEKELQNAKDSFKLAKTALSYVIGYKGSFKTSTVQEVKSLTSDVSDLQQKALKDRLDLKSARLNALMAERDRTETWTKWIPTFDVTYSWNWNSTTGFINKNDSWRLIFGAKWSLLEGGYKIADMYEKGSQIRQAHNFVEQLDLDIREEVEQAKLNLEKQNRNVEFSLKQVALAEETHGLIRRQYELGMASSLDVLDATTKLSNARMGLIIEQLQRDIAALSLNKAAGKYNELAGM